MHEAFEKVGHPAFEGGVSHLKNDPNQFRWGPIPHAEEEKVDFVHGIQMQGTREH